MAKMILTIGGLFEQTVDTLEHASLLYSNKRDASGEGASTFPTGQLMFEDGTVAHVSYNGRIWKRRNSIDSKDLLYDNRKES